MTNRQIILDTETTGLDPLQGHRIIELAGLEVVNRRPTGRTVQFFLDPERDIDLGATEVHGKTWEDLRGKPKFRDIVAEFLDFARGAEWIIHNAPFDVAFLDYELSIAGHAAGPGKDGESVFCVANLKIDLARRQVLLNERAVHLSPLAVPRCTISGLAAGPRVLGRLAGI